MMGWYQEGWAWGTSGMILMVAFWSLLIAGAVWAVARFTRSDPAGGATLESPRAILDRRFACGDIGVEEYAQARHVLESKGVEPTSG